MSLDMNTSIISRLRSAEGHLKAVTTMVETGESSEQVLHQLHAVQGALKAIAQLWFEQHIKETEAVIKFSECPEDREQALDYLTMLYQWTFNHK